MSIKKVAVVGSVIIYRGITLAPGELVLCSPDGYLRDERRHLITFHDTEYGLKGAIEYIKEHQKC